MTKKQRIEHKIGNQLRREMILSFSKHKKKGMGNLCTYLGGVIQAGKYSTK